jgi:D-aminoacyl-tRNA deacylase
MRTLLQRVKRATVELDHPVDLDSKVVGSIADGLLIFLGVTKSDTQADADWLVEKILKLRIFSKDAESVFDATVIDIEGAILVVSQFTLYGDCRKGTRPSFSAAAPAEQAKELYNYFVGKLQESSLHIETGEFGEHMEVDLVNDGPVTLIIDSTREK